MIHQEGSYFGLFNVVWYDGYEAYVSKFILEHHKGNITPSAMSKLEDYLKGNGEILKVDYRFSITFEDITKMIESTESSDKLIIDQFSKMYF